MNPVDDEILEYLAEEHGGTRKLIADELGRAPNYIGDRLRVLTEMGLVEKPSYGFYRITEAGRAYLRGDLDASSLE